MARRYVRDSLGRFAETGGDRQAATRAARRARKRKGYTKRLGSEAKTKGRRVRRNLNGVVRTNIQKRAAERTRRRVRGQ